MELVITPEKLAKWMEKQAVTIIDVRSNLKNPDEGEAAYRKSHLPSAFYLHLERDLSGQIGEHGGSHPLPPLNMLISKLEQIGVTLEKPVIIYDAANDMFAARAWWLLHYLGHEKVYVLDGGFKAWMQAGFTVTAELPVMQPSVWNGNSLDEMTVSMKEVKNRNIMKTVIIDSRARERYLGNTEPLYKKAGHIPGAKNYFWQDVLQENGSWKTVAQLEEHFADLDKDADIIVSCGSGISACPNIIALKKAGFNHVRLYPGSYSDWISYDDNIVHKGEE